MQGCPVNQEAQGLHTEFPVFSKTPMQPLLSLLPELRLYILSPTGLEICTHNQNPSSNNLGGV